MTKTRFPIVIARETNGAYSAYVPGLPIYAAADSARVATAAIRRMLAEYVEAYPEAASTVQIEVATITQRASRRASVAVGSLATLLGAARSQKKAASSRANGKLGGRPRA